MAMLFIKGDRYSGARTASDLADQPSGQFDVQGTLLTFGLLAAYIRRQPSRELYRVEGPLACVMHALQAGAAVYATAAARWRQRAHARAK